jgi:hypothetical protein
MQEKEKENENYGTSIPSQVNCVVPYDYEHGLCSSLFAQVMEQDTILETP